MRILLTVLLLIITALVGCTYTEKVSTNFINTLKSPDAVFDYKLVNRVYQHCENADYNIPISYKNGVATKYIDTPFLCRPLSFFKNGIVLLEPRNIDVDSIDSDYYNGNHSNFFYKEGGWGIYKINKDTISAIIYIDFLGGLFFPTMILTECSFSGILKNKDTISEWHLATPYPNIKEKIPSNLEYLEYLKKPVDLYYKDVPIEKTIDPDKAWINKYKTK